jgi:uncharacterized protein (DUF302 family)
MRNRLFCSVLVGLVTPFWLCGHLGSAVCSASEQSDEAKTPRLPDPACCFAGMIRAKVVAQHDEGVIVAVEEVEKTWKANKAQKPDSLVGKQILVKSPKKDNRYAERIDRFIESLRVGETVTLDVAHKGEGEALTILELTEDQRARRPMLYVREAAGSVDEVVKKLEEAATANKFGVLTVHNLKQKLNAKGVDFGPECSIVEVCNPQKAKSVLEADMSISVALPCRISIYEEDGTVKVSTLRPTAVLGLFGRPELVPIAKEVEEVMIRMIDAACQ